MIKAETAKASLGAALPIMAGYMVLGIPCGILASQTGLNALQVLMMSLLFYSGAGQYMIANMWLAGIPPLSIVASVSLVNTRQMLYGASLSRFSGVGKKRLSFLFAATVTDESFGINLDRFEKGDWSLVNATLVNLFSQTSWTLANVIGVVAGAVLSIPAAVASFAMTAIFICLLFSQKATMANVVAGIAAAVGVVVCKLVGLSGPAIFIGAVFGIIMAFALSEVQKRQ